MIDYTRIVEAFKPLFSVPVFSGVEINGYSGNDNLFAGHPLVTIQNMKSVLDDKRVYREFVNGEAIKKNEVVKVGADFYIASQDIAAANTTQLTQTNLTEAFINGLFDETVRELFRLWISTNSIDGWGREIESHKKSVYSYDQKPLDNNSTYKIGLFTTPDNESIIKLKRLNIYSRKDIEATLIINGTSQTENLTIGINKIELDLNETKDYVTISVINDSFLVRQPSCTGGRHVRQVEFVDNTRNHTRGFELEYSYICDFTQHVIDNADKFIYAIQLLYAIKFLEELVSNPHSTINRNEANVNKDDMVYQLDGNVNTKGYTLKGRFMKAFKSISPEFLPNGGVCSKCQNSKLSWGTV